MGKVVDLSGRRFERLFVVERADNYVSPNGKMESQWKCLCKCGNTTVVRAYNLTSGHTNSCGCLQRDIMCAMKTKHGFASGQNEDRIYRIWRGMKSRCYVPSCTGYADYGGRGICVCDDWLEFEGFLSWALSSGYTEELSLDRKEVDKNYEPDNCRWADGFTQANNKRSNRRLVFGGESKTIAEWAAATGINYGTILNGLRRGYPPERVLAVMAS